MMGLISKFVHVSELQGIVSGFQNTIWVTLMSWTGVLWVIDCINKNQDSGDIDVLSFVRWLCGVESSGIPNLRE
jgi:hypothetical protein